MIERIDIECTPLYEECAQVGDRDYQELATLEAETYREQLLREWVKGNPRRSFPTGLKILVKRNRHDFGVYISLQIVYDDSSADQEQAAFWLEDNQPERWDHESRIKLGLL